MTNFQTFNLKSALPRFAAYALLAVAAVVAFMAMDSQAQTADTGTANTLKVSPLRTDVSADPGETKTVPITVTNPANQRVSVRIIQNDFVADGEDGTPAIILEEGEYAESHSLKRFMTPLEDVVLEPNESKVVEVELVVPDGAEPGGYYGSVRFAPTDPDTGGQVNANISVASLILLTVNGEAPEKLDLTDFAIRQDGRGKTIFVNPDGINVIARFENKGRVHAGPFGRISVTKGDEIVHEADFNTQEQRDMVLPGSARTWDVEIEDIAGPGLYTVSATFTYGANNQTIEVTESFWFIPKSLIIAGIIGVVLLTAGIVGGIVYVRRRNASMQRAFGSRRR